MKNEKKVNLNKVENTAEGKLKINKAMIGKIVFIASIICVPISGIMLGIILNLGKEGFCIGIRIAVMVLLIVGILSAIFSFEYRPRSKRKAKLAKKQDDAIAKYMFNISDHAFDGSLVVVEDYTLFKNADGTECVKKEVEWICIYVDNSLIQGLFTITTDIATFVFQIKDGEVYRIPADSNLSECKDVDQIEQSKAYISNLAFNELLVSGKDYTVVAKVNGMMLVNKELKWLYFAEDELEINSVFTITTDISTFAVQVDQNKIFLLPTAYLKSLNVDIDND